MGRRAIVSHATSECSRSVRRGGAGGAGFRARAAAEPSRRATGPGGGAFLGFLLAVALTALLAVIFGGAYGVTSTRGCVVIAYLPLRFMHRIS